MDVIVPSRPYLKHPLVQAMRRSDLKQNDDLLGAASFVAPLRRFEMLCVVLSIPKVE